MARVRDNNSLKLESARGLVMTDPQLATLGQEITVLTSQLQERTDLLSRQTVKAQRLEKINGQQFQQLR